MYIPRTNREDRPDVLFDFIEAHSLGALVTADASGEPFATHLPLVVHRGQGPHGTLEGHLARANPHLRHMAGPDPRALVIFTGPQAYVTPSWYPGKATHGREVPTWNYVAVHAYATVRLVEDPGWLHRHLDELSARHEAHRPDPWTPSDAPADYVAQLLRGIVGIELAIDGLEGKWKMSQNRTSADIDGVVAGLGASERAEDREVARIVEQRRPH